MVIMKALFLTMRETELKSQNDNFEHLKSEILRCRECRDKFGFESHPIVLGCTNSKIIQISQAPSQNVHDTLKPFNDASGRKLREKWYNISEDDFYNTENFYFTSVAHCYPGKSKNGGDRQPPISCARKWLMREIEAVDNKIFILIGRKAADFFFSKQDFSELVFSDNEIKGKPAFVLPHPSPLNIKWFKDNPEFLYVRVREVERAVHEVLNLDYK